MIIRDATEADLPAIVAIFNAAVRTRMSSAQLAPVTVEERLPWFHQHSPNRHPLWAVENAGTIAGWLSFQPFTGRAAYRATAEVSVYVHEEFRRRGVGQALLEQALERSPALALTALLGFIFGHNEASIELFQHAGFDRWGLLPRVARVDGTERDIVILGRHVESANER